MQFLQYSLASFFIQGGTDVISFFASKNVFSDGAQKWGRRDRRQRRNPT
jgi:hypothetical protein